MSMMMILDPSKVMTMKKRLNPPSTKIMKKKYKNLKTNKGYHQEKGRLQARIVVWRILEGQSQRLEVEAYDSISSNSKILIICFSHVV